MKSKRLLAALLSCCICGSITAFAAQPQQPHTESISYDSDVFSQVFASSTTQYSRFTGQNYTLPDGYTVYNGIDVSSWNDSINWNAVSKDGVDFVFLRVAFRGTKTGDLREDPNYSTYLTGASSAGIPIGVYVFSQALNTAEAVEEAQFAIDRVKTANIQLPIVMDYEYSDGSGRLDTAGLSQSEKTANVLAFCNTIRDAGYEPMLYATKSFLTNDVNTNQIRNSGVKIWLAHYTTSTSFSNYDYWQYSRAGSVQGISADVDCNFYLTHGDLIAPTPICGFQDVLSTDWFAPAVRFAFQNRLMNGTSSTQFAPSLSLTRAMVAQVLYNFSGAPAVTQPSSFSDVPSDQWFANAVAWAQQNGIMNGYPNNTFGANDPITRQDFAVVLYHYSSQQQLDTSTRANLNSYRDVSSVASYAQDAMQWAVASKIISGKSSTQLAPRDSATRAECAQILKNYLTGVASSLLGS